MLLEDDQVASGDDSGIGGLRVKCRGPGMSGTDTHKLAQYVLSSDSEWTGWAGGCPTGTAVCSLKTRVQPDESAGTANSMIDAKMYCCDY